MESRPSNLLSTARLNGRATTLLRTIVEGEEPLTREAFFSPRCSMPIFFLPCSSAVSPLEVVCAHIDGALDDGLTAEKVRHRGQVLETTDGAVVFEVERHTAASGALYTEGQPMSAFITYWPCYRFDLETKELTRLEERRPREFECNYDMLVDELSWGLFEFRVSREEGSWVCEERVSNETEQVESIEEAEAFAESFIRTWDLETFFGPELREALEEAQVEEHFSTLEQLLVEKVRAQVRRAWKRREGA